MSKWLAGSSKLHWGMSGFLKKGASLIHLPETLNLVFNFYVTLDITCHHCSDTVCWSHL